MPIATKAPIMPTRALTVSCSLLAFVASALPAHADDLFAGVYAHGVDTPFTFETEESGADVAVGYRFDRIKALGVIGKPAPYLIASLNTSGDTSFAGGGLSWSIGKGPVYLRPAVGLVIHDGPSYRVNSAGDRRTELGSRILFEPEIAVGYRVGDRIAIEASWMHISQGRLFNAEQNPGIDMVGARLNLGL